MTKLFLYVTTAALISTMLLTTACSGQSPTNATIDEDQLAASTSPKARKIDSLISTYARYGDFNGAILVAEVGKVLFRQGFGLADMERDIPNTSTTKFRIGSVTKQFTAMLIMQLVADGKLELHVPIANYLPGYPRENGQKITVHHLLTHSSGIPNNYASTKATRNRPDAYTAAELVDEFSNLPLLFTPGEKFDYSNAGYTLLGYIIETVTEKRYEDVLQERIFTPLGMKNTGYDKHRALIKTRAAGYFQSWGDHYNANYVDMSTVYAAGALYSTVEDLFLWDQALYTGQLLPREYLDMLFTRHIPDSDEGGDYGYGWTIKKKPIGNSGNHATSIGHDGVIDGFCAVFTRIPDTKSTIILLSNVRRAPLNTMTQGIMGILYDQPYDFPRRSLAYSLLEIAEKDGIAKGIEHFEAMKDNSAYYLSEDELNVVSYKFLQSDRPEDAAAVLKLGISAFPDAFNLYDSYGEVLRKLGKPDEAIENYLKSVKLNPGNENGWRILEELGVDTASLKQ